MEHTLSQIIIFYTMFVAVAVVSIMPFYWLIKENKATLYKAACNLAAIILPVKYGLIPFILNNPKYFTITNQ